MPDTCPTRLETFHTLLALLPRGRAWQSHDASIPQSRSVLRRFWYGIAGPLHSAEEALCKALDEYFAATADDDLDLWLEEYGLPNPETGLGADDLLAMVSATGGTSTAYYEEWAARAGYVTEMRWLKGDDPDFPGEVSTLYVRVDATASSAIPSVSRTGVARAGLQRMGSQPTNRLERMLHNLIPAQCAIIYEVI